MRHMFATLRDWFQQDVRYALRGLRRSPGFTATVILTLGLGIGANAAMFGVIDRLMFRPYPYLRDPATVHRVYLRSQNQGTLRTRWDSEYTSYLDLQRWATSFSQYAAFAQGIMAVGVGDASRERRIATVSATFFDFFNARPALGRFFSTAEDVPPRGAEVAVLGYAFWKSEFGARDVRGEILQIGGIRATILGVAPEGFAGVSDNDPPAAYVPITTYAATQSNARNAATYFTAYSWRFVEIMVRRRPGVSVAQASADLTQAYVRSWNARRAIETSLPPAELARPNAIASAMKIGAGPDPSLEARTALWVTGVAAIVLLIACANVANLFLARALKRQRELAVRLALGVSGRRLMVQSLTESLLLAVLGSAAGLFVAQWGGAGIRRFLLTNEGPSLDVFTDWRTLGVATAIAVAAGLLTGLAPALLPGRGDLARSLKAGAREGTYYRSRTRAVLLVTQGALSVVLLVGAGLFMKSLGNVQTIRMGYDADPVLFASRNLRGMRLSDSALVALRRTLLATAQAVPGVEYAAWVSSVPFWITNATSVFVPGIDSVEQLGQITYQTASADYFRTMRTRIVRGRGLTTEDRADAPRIAVVSAALATALWPGKDAIGQCMRVFADTMPCATVVGIAENIVQDNLAATPRLHYYLPVDQFFPTGGAGLLIRMRGDAVRQLEAVRKALQSVMPGSSYVTVRPLRDRIDGAQRSWRLGATMFVAFAALALVVAAVGLYGVISYNVAQRMHELGVRIALGARTMDVVRLVVGQGVRFACIGVATGLGVALLAAHWIQPLLFQQSARDPATYGVVAGLLLLVALVASAVPALRATRADPNSALRVD